MVKRKKAEISPECSSDEQPARIIEAPVLPVPVEIPSSAVYQGSPMGDTLIKSLNAMIRQLLITTAEAKKILVSTEAQFFLLTFHRSDSYLSIVVLHLTVWFSSALFLIVFRLILTNLWAKSWRKRKPFLLVQKMMFMQWYVHTFTSSHTYLLTYSDPFFLYLPCSYSPIHLLICSPLLLSYPHDLTPYHH